MVPLGKYHCCEVPLRHGASDQPDGPWIDWVTATPPPESTTVWEIQVPARCRADR